VDLVLQLLATGVVVGSLYALCALGWGLIYGTTLHFHVAHGAVFALAAYYAYVGQKLLHLPLLAAVAAAVLAAAATRGELLAEGLRRVAARLVVGHDHDRRLELLLLGQPVGDHADLVGDDGDVVVEVLLVGQVVGLAAPVHHHDLVLGADGLDRERGRRVRGEGEGNLLDFDQAPHGIDGLGGVGGMVLVDDLDLAPPDAAGGIDLLGGHLGAALHPHSV